MKRFFALLLCFAFIFSAVACGKKEAPAGNGTETAASSASAGSSDSTDVSGTDSVSADTDAGSLDTDSGTSDPAPEPPATNVPEQKTEMYNPELEHLVLLDTASSRFTVLNLNAEGDISDLRYLEDAVIWEWDPSMASNCQYPNQAGSAGSKFRYSSYWKKDVILLGNSNGWVGIIDYETKQLLLEDMLPAGPHCVEMMPNGDFVVAVANNSQGKDQAGLYYYPLSQGATEHSHFAPLPGCHAVCYDPKNDCLWTVGDYEVRAYTVSGYGTPEAKLLQIQGLGASLEELGDIGGHNMTPVYGEPGKYWVTSIKGMWLFDTETGSLSKNYAHRDSLDYANIKGMAYFPDGTAVQAGYVGGGGNPEYCSTALRIVTRELSGGKVKKIVPVIREIPYSEVGVQSYKVQRFTKAYQ